MKICHYLDIRPTQEAPGVAKYDVITPEDGAPNFRMRVFEIEPDSSTPSHFHPWEHEVFVISGRGVVVGEEGGTEIGKGSVVFVAPNENHCFVNKGHDPLRIVCLIPIVTE